MHEITLSPYTTTRTITVKMVGVADSTIIIDGNCIASAKLTEGEDGVLLGGAVAKEIDVEINLLQLSAGITINTGWKFDAFVGINGTWCPLGRFWVDSVSINNNIATVKAYDGFARLSARTPDRYSNPVDCLTRLTSIVNLYKTGGLSSKETGIFINYSGDMEEEITNPATYSFKGNARDIVCEIAKLNGKIAVMTRDGYLAMRDWTEVDDEYSIPYTAQYLGGFKQDKATTYTVGTLNNGETVMTSPAPSSSANSYDVESTYMKQAGLNRVGSAFCPFAYTPGSVEYRCDPRLEIGDKVRVYTGDSSYVSLPITSQSIEISGGLKSTITTSIPDGDTGVESLTGKNYSQYATKGEVADGIESVETDLDDTIQRVDDIEEAVGDDNSGLISRVNALTTRVGKAETDITDVEEAIGDDTTAGTLKYRVTQAEGEMDTIEDEIDDLDEAISSAQQTISDAQAVTRSVIRSAYLTVNKLTKTTAEYDAYTIGSAYTFARATPYYMGAVKSGDLLAVDFTLSDKDSRVVSLLGQATADASANANVTMTVLEKDYLDAYFWHDNLGAHVLGDTYRTDIKDGMSIVDMSGSTEVEVASFTAEGIHLGGETENYVNITEEDMAIVGANTTLDISNGSIISTYNNGTNNNSFFAVTSPDASKFNLTRSITAPMRGGAGPFNLPRTSSSNPATKLKVYVKYMYKTSASGEWIYAEEEISTTSAIRYVFSETGSGENTITIQNYLITYYTSLVYELQVSYELADYNFLEVTNNLALDKNGNLHTKGEIYKNSYTATANANKVPSCSEIKNCFEVVDCEVTTDSIAPGSYQSAEIVQIADIPTGFKAIAVVGQITNQYRITPTTCYIVDDTHLKVGFKNTASSGSSYSTTMTFEILCILNS